MLDFMGNQEFSENALQIAILSVPPSQIVFIQKCSKPLGEDSSESAIKTASCWNCSTVLNIGYQVIY